MTNGQPNSRRRRPWRWAIAGLVILGVFLFVAWYLTSPHFQNYVRARVVAKLEDVTGGRVELKSLTWKLSQLEFDIRDLTIHGKEAPGQLPYAHADRLLVRAKIGVLFRPKLGLRYLEIDRPTIHFIVYPDGTTNQPAPRVAPGSAEASVERLFDLTVNRAEIRDGQLLVNGHPIPLDFSAEGVSAAMDYAVQPARYDGSVQAEKIETRYRDMLPFASSIEAQFGLSPTSVELKALRWSSGRSVLQASGRISDYNHPKLELAYNARLDLAQFAGLIRAPQVRAGMLELSGQGTYSAGGFASAGTLLVRDLDYIAPALRVRNASVGAQFSGTNERLLFSHLFAHVLGGTVTGDAEVRNWANPAGSAGPPQEGAARLRLQNVPAPVLAAAVSTRSLPLDRLNLAGTANGTVSARWKGSLRNAQTAITAEVLPPVGAAPDQLPVSAKANAEYFGATGELRLTEFSLATRATRVTASGVLGRVAGNIKLAAATTNLDELRPVLTAFHGPRQLPVALAGRASFDGTVSGRLSAPTIAGHLQATDFDTMLVPARQQGSPARRAHWDLLSADILYSPKMAAARRAVLRSGQAQVNFDASASLQRGRFTSDSPLAAHLIVNHAAISDLQALAGYDYPVTGIVNANLGVTGTQRDPRASGHIAISSATAYGEPISSLMADVRFANREAQAANINLAHNGARITGTAAYHLDTAAFRFDLRGANLNLARIRRLQTARLALGGTMNFTARGSGTWDAPSLDASVRLTNLVLNGEKAGDLTAEAVTTGADLRLTAHSNFQNADLRFEGGVHLRDPFPATIGLRFAHLDFDPLLRAYLKGRIAGHSSMAGSLELRGPLRRPRDLEITGAIDQLSANVENIPIRNDGPIRFGMAGQTLRLEQLRLLGEDTSVVASGTAQIGGPRQLDLRSEGRLNLKLLQSYDPGLSSYGEVTFNLNIGGVMSNPAIQGQVKIANAGVAYRDWPNGLADINGLLMFNRDRLVVQSFTAHTGGGDLSAGGFVTYSRGLAFNLTAAGRDIRLRYPQGISSMVNADLTLTGSQQNAMLGGDITITRFGVNPQFDFALYLARAKQPPEVPKPNSPLNNLHFDVHIASTPELQVQTSQGAKLSGDVDLRLRGVAAKPAVLGRVNIIEGEIPFNGARYRIERGDILFTNPVRIEPVLDVEATARVKEYDVTLGFHGPLGRLVTTYRSDPPLPTADIVALLALGRTREEAATQTQQQPGFTESASYALLGQALNAAVSSRVQRIFGVGRIKIDPQAANQAGSTYTGPQLNIEQQVNNNITLTYVSNLSQGSYQTIQMQYDVNRNVSIIAVRDDFTGVVSFDVKIRHRKK